MKQASGLTAGLSLAALCGALAVIIFFSEGMRGFAAFLNLEALALIVGGTPLLVWAAYPLDEILRPRSPEVLAYAARSARVMGLLGTLLGLIMLLSSVSDAAEVPRRLALTFDALLFGLLLSEAVLVPWGRRLERSRLT